MQASTSSGVAAACDALATAVTDEDIAAALISIAQFVDMMSEGAEMEAMCEMLRQKAVAQICDLTSHPTPIIHQSSLMLLANFTTIEVDANAEATKAIIKASGCMPGIVTHLFSMVALTVAYSCATVQNTCNDMDFVTILRELGAVECVGHDVA